MTRAAQPRAAADSPACPSGNPAAGTRSFLPSEAGRWRPDPAGAEEAGAAPIPCLSARMRADARMPGAVRDLIAAVARHEGLSEAVVDAARLLASELAANAFRAYDSRGLEGRAEVTVTIGVGELAVAVADDAPGVPTLLAAHDGAEVGRGLVIVDLVSRAWGWTGGPGGKRVWFTLPLNMPDSYGMPVPGLDARGDAA